MRLLALSVALAFLIAPLAVANIPNPIPNSGFESWSDGVPSFYSWYFGAIGCTTELPVFQGEGYTGSSSLGLTGVNLPCPSFRLWSDTGDEYPIPVEGLYGSVVMHYKSLNISNDFSFHAEFYGGAELEWHLARGRETSFPSTDEWTRIEVPIVRQAPGVPSWVFIVFDSDGNNADSWLMVDDVYFAGAITEPEEDELWISGETDTIRWSPSDWNRFNITCVLDEGTPYERVHEIGSNLNLHHAEEYVWEIPDSLLSHHTRIIVENAQSPGETMESDLFRLRGYVLAEFDAVEEIYKPFAQPFDAWSFTNNEANLWPLEWWEEQYWYDAVLGTDPYTGGAYDESFAGVWRGDYPCWPDFVKAFGIEQCYWDVPLLGLQYRERAVEYWKSIRHMFAGSCFGMSTSSAMLFYDRALFNAAYPEFIPYEYPGDFFEPLSVPDGAVIRPLIASLFTHQFGQTHNAYNWAGENNVTPSQTVEAVKQLFLEDNPNPRTLSLVNFAEGKAHNILPYKLVPDRAQPGQYDLYVYDCSLPGDDAAKLRIDTTTNGGEGSWNYANSGWGDSRGLYLGESSSSFFNTPIIPGVGGPGRDPGEITLHVNPRANVLVENASGQTTGCADGQVHNDIPGAHPSIAFTPDDTGGPYGYELPPGDYSLAMSAFADSCSRATFFSDTTLYACSRNDAEVGHSDLLKLNPDGLMVKSLDVGVEKHVELKSVVSTSIRERTFEMVDLMLTDVDSVSFGRVGPESLELRNFGAGKLYSLRIKQASPTDYDRFQHAEIPLPANTTHTLAPDWGNLVEQGILIVVDEGNDGVPDDSLYVQNEPTGVEDHGEADESRRYHLGQNHPNPFNPATKITRRTARGLRDLLLPA